MIEDLTEILFMINFVIFCCVCIPYEFLWIIRPRKGRIVTGITNAFVYSIVFTVLVIYVWYVAVIIWLLLGFWLASKVKNRGRKLVVIGIVLVVAVLLSVIGIENRRELKNDTTQEQLYEEEYADSEYDGSEGDEWEDTESIGNVEDTENEWEDTELIGDVEDTEDVEVVVDNLRAYIEEYIYYEAFAEYSLLLIYEGDHCKEYELHMREYNEHKDKEYITDSRGTVKEESEYGIGTLIDEETGQQWEYEFDNLDDHYIIYLTGDDGTDVVLHEKAWADENAG